MIDASRYCVHDTLRDGTPIVILAIRPEDRERLRTAFSKLEPETVYTRFFSYRTELTEKELRDATEVDFERVVTLLVKIVEDGQETIIASGRYLAYVAADGASAAEVAFTVEEDYHGEGLASRLFAHLATIARAKGIVRFEAEVLPQNVAMLRVFAKSGLPMTKQRDDGVMHVTVELGHPAPDPGH